MAVEINGETYLTVTEAAFILKTPASHMTRMIYKSEFRGLVNINDNDPLIKKLAEHRIDLNEEEYAKLASRVRAVYLIPFSSVLDKMARRKERKIVAKIRKEIRQQKRSDRAKRVHPPRIEGAGTEVF